MKYRSSTPKPAGTGWHRKVEAHELFAMLKREKTPHSVLKCQVSHAGGGDRRARRAAGTVTIATNMAGRGTDIKLGSGVPDSAACTSSARNGTKRAVSTASCADAARARAIRALRISSFSFEDDLMRISARTALTRCMERFGLEEGQELEHPWLNRRVETAQKRVEQQNYLAANARSISTT